MVMNIMIILCLLLIYVVNADLQLISPIFGESEFKNIILSNIASANSSIKATIYKLDDEDVINELKNSGERGITFDLLCDKNAFIKCLKMEKYGKIAQFKEKNYNKLHAKSILIDNTVLILGSFNMDSSAFTTNMEIGIIVEDENLIKNYNNFMQKVKE